MKYELKWKHLNDSGKRYLEKINIKNNPEFVITIIDDREGYYPPINEQIDNSYLANKGRNIPPGEIEP